MAIPAKTASPWTDRLPPWMQQSLPLLAALSILAVFFVAVLFNQGSPGRTVSGRVSGFGLLESKAGGRAFATVTLESGRQPRVGLSRTHNCRVGDRILLTETDGIFGKRYSAPPYGCERR